MGSPILDGCRFVDSTERVSLLPEGHLQRVKMPWVLVLVLVGWRQIPGALVSASAMDGWRWHLHWLVSPLWLVMPVLLLYKMPSALLKMQMASLHPWMMSKQPVAVWAAQVVGWWGAMERASKKAWRRWAQCVGCWFIHSFSCHGSFLNNWTWRWGIVNHSKWSKNWLETVYCRPATHFLLWFSFYI